MRGGGGGGGGGYGGGGGGRGGRGPGAEGESALSEITNQGRSTHTYGGRYAGQAGIPRRTTYHGFPMHWDPYHPVMLGRQKLLVRVRGPPTEFTEHPGFLLTDSFKAAVNMKEAGECDCNELTGHSNRHFCCGGRLSLSFLAPHLPVRLPPPPPLPNLSAAKRGERVGGGEKRRCRGGY